MNQRLDSLRCMAVHQVTFAGLSGGGQQAVSRVISLSVFIYASNTVGAEPQKKHFWAEMCLLTGSVAALEHESFRFHQVCLQTYCVAVFGEFEDRSWTAWVGSVCLECAAVDSGFNLPQNHISPLWGRKLDPTFCFCSQIFIPIPVECSCPFALLHEHGKPERFMMAIWTPEVLVLPKGKSERTY